MTIHEQDIAYEARKEGKQETQIETAKKFFKMGLSIEQFSEGTGLSLEKVKEVTSFSVEQLKELVETQ